MKFRHPLNNLPRSLKYLKVGETHDMQSSMKPCFFSQNDHLPDSITHLTHRYLTLGQISPVFTNYIDINYDVYDDGSEYWVVRYLLGICWMVEVNQVPSLAVVEGS